MSEENNTQKTCTVASINSNLKATFSANLEKLLEIHQITQNHLAAVTGTSTAAINAYIKGVRLPKIDFLLSLKNLYDISIDDFLTKSTNPDDYIIPEASQADKKAYEIAHKYCGSYFTYYFDTSSYKGRDTNDEQHSLKYGILSIFENSGPLYKSTFSTIAILGLDDIKTAESIKEKIDSYEKTEDMVNYIGVHHATKMYHGDFTLGENHVFLTMEHGNRDKALLILYKISNNKPTFRGGMGTINSASKGRESMPTIQFMGISRDKILLSEEEIHQALLMHYPTFHAHKETEELIKLFKHYYMKPEHEQEAVSLSDFQKSITIRANLERYIKASLKTNLFRYGKVSNRDDDEWYHLIKECAQKQSDE